MFTSFSTNGSPEFAHDASRSPARPTSFLDTFNSYIFETTLKFKW